MWKFCQEPRPNQSLMTPPCKGHRVSLIYILNTQHVYKTGEEEGNDRIYVYNIIIILAMLEVFF